MNPPETFAHLLAKAGDLRDWQAMHFCGPDCQEPCRHSAHAQIDNRLKAFAHAGGYQFLYNLMRYDGARLTADGMEQLEILLQTLNNPSK